MSGNGAAAADSFVHRGGHQRRTNRGGGSRQQQGIQRCRFEGRKPTLRGHIYDFTGKPNPDQFIQTTNEVVIFVGRMYTKYRADFMQAVQDLHQLEDPPEPAIPKKNPQNVFDMEDWKWDFKEHRSKVFEYSNFKSGLYTS